MLNLRDYNERELAKELKIVEKNFETYLDPNLTESTKFPRLYRRWDVSANAFVQNKKRIYVFYSFLLSKNNICDKINV